MARKRKLAAAIFSLGCLHAGSIWALGLGELTLESFLNEPLRAKVNLLNTGGLHEDQIRVRLATADDFDRLGIDRAYFLTGIKFDVVIGADGGGVIILSSDDPVLEPYLDFIVETRWPSGRLLREYTILVDPPAFDSAEPPVSASRRVEEVEGIPAPAKKNREAEADDGSGRSSEVQSERQFGAESAANPTAGSRYLIQRNETLWQIALRAKPEGVSVHQTMLDIKRLNPDAFIDDNINRIKAGFMVYLPLSADISSGDIDQALAEIEQQNKEWRAGRAADDSAAARPALRISAGEEVGETEPGEDQPRQQRDTAAATAAALEDLERSELEREELTQRVDSLNDQLQTLERIVAVKDNQIAALQAALGDDSASDTLMPGAEESEELRFDEGGVEVDAEGFEEPDASVAVDEPEATPAPAVAPATRTTPVVTTAPETGGGNWLYILGGILLAAILGLLFWRRRTTAEAAGSASSVNRDAKADVFAGVELKDQELDVDDSIPTDEAFAVDSVDELEEVTSKRNNRGYGERKHDEYASDVDAGDALAEADIYIAYGRYPQAIDLLQNAIKAEPGNPTYRLKLLEVCVEIGRNEEAARQYAELQAINDPRSLEQAAAFMASMDNQDDTDTSPLAAGSGLEETVPAVDFTGDLGSLEDDFGGLDLDQLDDGHGNESDSSDEFSLADANEDDEELVFAAEGSEISTKLDLARAYIDMGDEDGARQILEEVVSEGNPDQQEEARSLMAKFG